MKDIKQMNLYEKISYAIQLFQSNVIIPPQKSQIGSGNFAYKAFLAEDVVRAGNEAFFKSGLILITNNITNNIIHYDIESKNGVQTRVECHLVANFKLVNIDKPDEYEVISIPAIGQDNGDKAVNKALTYAQKYAIMQILKLQDPFDGDSEVSEPSKKILKLDSIAITEIIQNINNQNCNEKLQEYYKNLCLVYSSDLIKSNGQIIEAFKNKKTELTNNI